MVDPATLTLLATGLKIANESYKLYSQVQDRQSQQAIETQALRGLLQTSTQSLQEAITQGADRVIEKIEQDKMEELGARLQNLDMLLRMKKSDQVWNYIMQVRESVSYAQNRMNEGKKHWFLPLITGKAMMAATFAFLGDEDTELVLELERLRKEAKTQILNEATSILVQARQELPWDLINDVNNNVEGSVEKLVEEIANAQKLLIGKEEYREESHGEREKAPSPHRTSTTIIELNDSNFDDFVTRADLPVFVDFWADWCGPCNAMTPVLEGLASDYAGRVLFTKIDVDQSTEIPARFNISGIPTLLVMKRGKEVDRQVGVAPIQLLKKMIKKVL